MQPFYQFIIRDNKYDSYKKIASLLFFITGFIFLLKGIRMYTVFDKVILFGASFILLVYAVYMWLYKKRGERSFFIIYSLIIIVWLIATPYGYVSLAYGFLMILHYMMEKDFIIRVADNFVKVHGFLQHEHSWNDFNNIVIKDGLLTLDFKNNKILQAEPDWERSTNRDSRPFDQSAQISFNEFCKLHLTQ